MARDVLAPEASTKALEEIGQVYGCILVSNPYDRTWELKDMGLDADGDPVLSDRGTGKVLFRIRMLVYNQIANETYETPDMIGMRFREKVWTYFGPECVKRMRAAVDSGQRLKRRNPNDRQLVDFDGRPLDRGGEIKAFDMRDPNDPIGGMPKDETETEGADAATEAAHPEGGMADALNAPPPQPKVKPPRAP